MPFESDLEPDQVPGFDSSIPQIHFGMGGVLVAIILMMSGCISGGQRADYDLDLQGGFKDSPIMVYADGKLIFDAEVTSDSVTGLAKHINIVQCGELVVRASIYGQWLEKKVQLRPYRGRYLGIELNRVWEDNLLAYSLVFIQDTDPFIYY